LLAVASVSTSLDLVPTTAVIVVAVEVDVALAVDVASEVDVAADVAVVAIAALVAVVADAEAVVASTPTRPTVAALATSKAARRPSTKQIDSLHVSLIPNFDDYMRAMALNYQGYVGIGMHVDLSW